MSVYKHISVQKNKSIDYLNIKPDGVYVDCTFGRGGHSLEILKRLNENGKLISIDKDQEAKEYYEKEFEKRKNHIFIFDSFSNLEKMLNDLKIKLVDGFLFDFGLSSPMLDNPKRGFSYKSDGPLDMRMDQNQKFSAKELINNYSFDELNRIFRYYGDVKFPKYVSKAIIEYRENKKIETTTELVEIIRKSVHKKELNQKKHFARVYFQAIRMEVNKELDEINLALTTALKYLNKKGRIVTISFHSLEEKEVKKCFSKTLNKIYPKELPINNIDNEFKIINIKDKWVDNKEVKDNNRARSSLLKIIERN